MTVSAERLLATLVVLIVLTVCFDLVWVAVEMISR